MPTEIFPGIVRLRVATVIYLNPINIHKNTTMWKPISHWNEYYVFILVLIKFLLAATIIDQLVAFLYVTQPHIFLNILSVNTLTLYKVNICVWCALYICHWRTQDKNEQKSRKKNCQIFLVSSKNVFPYPKTRQKRLRCVEKTRSKIRLVIKLTFSIHTFACLSLTLFSSFVHSNIYYPSAVCFLHIYFH